MTRFEPTTTHRLSARVMAAITAVALIGGCSMFRSADEVEPIAANDTMRSSTTQQTYSSSMQVPQSLQPGRRPVVQDKLPLIYLVESAGTCRVTNIETGEEIAAFPVKESQIVRVESKGVLLANKQVIGAQLAAGTYAIEMISQGEVAGGVLRSTQTVTRAVPAASTKPATTRPATPAAPAVPSTESPAAPPASPATDLPPPK